MDRSFTRVQSRNLDIQRQCRPRLWHGLLAPGNGAGLAGLEINLEDRVQAGGGSPDAVKMLASRLQTSEVAKAPGNPDCFTRFAGA